MPLDMQTGTFTNCITNTLLGGAKMLLRKSALVSYVTVLHVAGVVLGEVVWFRSGFDPFVIEREVWNK